MSKSEEWPRHRWRCDSTCFQKLCRVDGAEAGNRLAGKSQGIHTIQLRPDHPAPAECGWPPCFRVPLDGVTWCVSSARVFSDAAGHARESSLGGCRCGRAGLWRRENPLGLFLRLKRLAFQIGRWRIRGVARGHRCAGDRPCFQELWAVDGRRQESNARKSQGQHSNSASNLITKPRQNCGWSPLFAPVRRASFQKDFSQFLRLPVYLELPGHWTGSPIATRQWARCPEHLGRRFAWEDASRGVKARVSGFVIDSNALKPEPDARRSLPRFCEDGSQVKRKN